MSLVVVLLMLSQSPSATAVTADVAGQEARAIGARLRCPVCQGMPISESPSEMAQAMMVRVREMVAEGKSRDEIITYFTQRYGDWVLLDPRKTGINVLLWGLPPVVLILGIFVVRFVAQRGIRNVPSAIATAKSDDPYLATVRDEVER